jgi:carboxyl-terminal processing protease
VKKWVLPVTVAISLTVGAVGGMYVESPDHVFFLKSNPTETEQDRQTDNRGEEWGKIGQAYDLIVNQYVEKVEQTDLVEGAIEGMLATLDDPYTIYMDQETAKQFSETLDSSFEGIGTEIGMEDNKIIIVAPYKDSPAENAGLKPRDQLLKIDGESVEGLDLNETRLKIRGKKGTTVKLEVKRSGAENPITFTITRDEIPLETVFSSVKEEHGKQIGYIEITMFSENTANDFKTELEQLEKSNIEGLIIDVRGNPGGLLSAVEKIIEQFIPKDMPYLQIAQRNGKTDVLYTELEQKKRYPLAVLIDKGSASASEILAGALQEAGGYALVGEKTFGKGTVQQAIPMGDGSNIKITLFKWLTPKGNWIHKKGIAPTIEVHQPAYFSVHPLTIEKTLQLDKANEQVKNAQEILNALGFETNRTDGYFDEKTETAVKAFQNVRNLKSTGKIDKNTAAELEAAILEKINDEKNDIQLRTALTLVAR